MRGGDTRVVSEIEAGYGVVMINPFIKGEWQ